MKTFFYSLPSLVLISGSLLSCGAEKDPALRPNILFAIADDQSFAHTGFAGCTFVNTPAFDRVAKEGVYFTNCFAGSPGCAPSRSSIVTGRYPWQNEQSGQHASSWMKKYVPFVDVLERNGYHAGFTGKGVDPFQYARNEKDSLWRKENAAGKGFNLIKYEDQFDERPATGISNANYFANFMDFMTKREKGQPFFFWYGAHEPHRAYEKDSWKRNEKQLADVTVPDFLPDNEVVRGDMLDYAVEIEWFDLHLQRMLDYLEKTGELENTIVIVTADNGMPFPRAKANCFEYGAHVPLAIRYPRKFPGGRIVNGPVSFVDLAPTILDMTGASPTGMQPITGKSMKPILESKKSGDKAELKKYVFSGRERHSSSRYQNWGYPQRAIRSRDYLLIWNQKPARWPAGAPQGIDPRDQSELLPMYGIDNQGSHHSDWAFTDIDGSPTKSFIVENYSSPAIHPYFEMAVDKRPEYELYKVAVDPYCLKNLADNPEYLEIKGKMKKLLMEELKRTSDPRVVGSDKEIFDSYARYGSIREFPDPAK